MQKERLPNPFRDGPTARMLKRADGEKKPREALLCSILLSGAAMARKPNGRERCQIWDLGARGDPGTCA